MGEVDIVLASDHGMSRVTRTINVWSMLKKVGLTPGRDFLYFLDSTTIRCWSENPYAFAALMGLFAATSGTRILDAAARRALYIPVDVCTGDVLVALDEGCVVFPDFFRRQTVPSGMHGYASVATEAGLPFLATEPAVAALLPGSRPLTHTDVWAVMRQRLGFQDKNRDEESPCTSSP
jgi:hypothetical protein